jgi:environmental stress-induced protein Ves
MRLTRLADVRSVPWRNGGGSTRVLATDSSGRQGGQFAWRISLAEIAGDGDFSAYPGVDRQLLACGPARWELIVDGRVHRLSPFDLVRFHGEAPAAARLDNGPATALNVMTLRGQADAKLEAIRVRESHEPAARDHVRLVVVLDGSFAVDGTGSYGLQLGDSIRLEALETVRLVGSGVVADVVVRQLPAPSDNA